MESDGNTCPTEMVSVRCSSQKLDGGERARVIPEGDFSTRKGF